MKPGRFFKSFLDFIGGGRADPGLALILLSSALGYAHRGITLEIDSHLHIVQAVASRGEGGMEWVPLMLAPCLREKDQQVSVWANPDSFLGRKAVERGMSLRSFHFRGHFHPLDIMDIRQTLR